MEWMPSPPEKKSSFSFRNMSLRKRLPLFVFLLLLSAVTLFSIVSYLSIKNLELKAGKQRLLSLTQQAANMFSESIREDFVSTRQMITGESISSFIHYRDEPSKQEAANLLEQIGKSGSAVFAEILDTGYQALLSAGDQSHKPLQRQQRGSDENIIAGKIYSLHDSVFYSITVPVLTSGKISGYVIRYRYVKITSKVIAQFSKLAGQGARLYVGNTDDNFYTDLFKPVQYKLPVAQSFAGKNYDYKNEKAEQMVGAFQFVTGTPWLVSMEFPYSVVVEGSSRFLLWLLLLGTIVVACGLLVAWIIGKNLTRPLNTLITAVTTVSSGEFTDVAVERNDEVGKLARSFNEMTLNLKDARTKMEEKMSEAENLSIQLRKLSAHLQNIREEERKRIAREMHDELGQLLTGFKMDLQLLKNHMPAHSNGRVAEHMQSMTSLIDDAVRFVRRLSTQLREGPLEDLGLIAAIQWYIQDFTKRYNIPVSFHSPYKDLQLSPQVKTGLFRICQESLTNIARHSQATKVEIDLDLENTELYLTVRDNGKGFKMGTNANTGSLGLLGMNERAIMIGATLSVQSNIGKGTFIKVAVPIGAKEKKIS